MGENEYWRVNNLDSIDSCVFFLDLCLKLIRQNLSELNHYIFMPWPIWLPGQVGSTFLIFLTYNGDQLRKQMALII